jgi:hypothetical protein
MTTLTVAYRSALLRYPDHNAEQFDKPAKREVDESSALLKGASVSLQDSPLQVGEMT